MYPCNPKVDCAVVQWTGFSETVSQVQVGYSTETFTVAELCL